jgi:ABC-type dipeptide/oligopeptide/nickel transport system permease component
MVITLFIIITIGFMVIRLMPGSMYADDADMTAAQLEILRAKYHLGKPIPVQYGIFLRDLVLKGDWGTSIKMYIGVPVFDVLKMKIPVSMYNNLLSLLISLPIGVLLGIIAAVRKNSIVDYTTLSW